MDLFLADGTFCSINFRSPLLDHYALRGTLKAAALKAEPDDGCEYKEGDSNLEGFVSGRLHTND